MKSDSTIKDSMAKRSSEELLAIIAENNRDEWRDEAFDAIHAILNERGVTAPPPPIRPIDVDSRYLAIIEEASVMTDGQQSRSGRNWGVLILTEKELIFVTKSRFRSIGIFGALGAPGIGLIIGLADSVIEKICGVITEKELSSLPPPSELKKQPDGFFILYQDVQEIVAKPLAFLVGDIELKFGESVIYLNVPKKIKQEYKKRGLKGAKLKEEYAREIASILGSCSGVHAQATPLNWKTSIMHVAFMAFLLTIFILVLRTI